MRRPRSVRKLSNAEPVRPEAVAPPGELLGDFLLRGDHRAADHVAVAVDVLGGRMHHDVGAERDGLLPARRQEGVVGHHQRADGMRALRDVGDIGDAQQRIAGRFDPHQRGGLRQRGVDRGRIAEVDEFHRELAALLPGGEQAERAAITIVRRDDARAHRQQVADQRDRAHARTRDDGARAAFEIRQRVGQQVARRIARAAVVVLALVAEAAKGIGGRQMQRRHHGAGHVAVFEAGAHRAGVLGSTMSSLGRFLDCRSRRWRRSARAAGSP